MAFKVAQVATVAFTINMHMRGWLRHLAERGFEVHTICSPSDDLEALREHEGVRAVHQIRIPRSIAPLADVRAFLRLLALMRRERFDIVHVSTPKAGLLAMLAARVTRVPLIIFTYRGLPLATSKGLMRRLLWTADWLTARLAHRLTCVSVSLRDELAKLGVFDRKRVEVIGHGSSNGVDVDRYRRRHSTASSPLRREWKVAPDAMVIGFVGRLAHDKGLAELVQAWQQIRARHRDAYLVVVGDSDDRDPLPQALRAALRQDARVRMPGWHANAASVYEAIDLLVLPSYREGFSNVLLEAGSVGIPVVASDVVGCRDAVVNEVTGLLIPPHDARALTSAIERLLANPDERERMGRAGREHVHRHFHRNAIWSGMLAFYLEGLEAAGYPDCASREPRS